MAFGDLLGSLSNGQTTTTNPTSVSGAVACSVGDLIVCVVAERGATSVTTVTASWSSTGAVSMAAKGVATTSGSVSSRLYWGRVTTAGTLTTLACACTATNDDIAIAAGVFAGPFIASPLDVSPADATDTASPFTCTATGTLAQATELVVCSVAMTVNRTMTATAPNLLAVQGNSAAAGTASSCGVALGYQVVGSTGTISPEFTGTNPSTAVEHTVSFKASTQALTPGLFTNTETFYSPTVVSILRTGYRPKPPWPQLQRGHRLARDLYGAWLFHDGSGQPAQEIVEHRDAAFTVAPSWVGSPFGSALSFNGTSQYLTAAAVSWNTAGPMTVALWVNSAGALGNGNSAFSIGTDDGVSRLQAHIPYLDNILYWDYGDVTTGRVSTDFTAYLNLWTHVVLVNDGTNFKAIYLNGKLATSGSGLPTHATKSSLTIGKFTNQTPSNFFFDGQMANFQLYSRVLTADEIAQHYQDSFVMVRPPTRDWTFVPSLTQVLTPALFTTTNTFYSPTVTPGAVALTPALFTTTNTFYAPTVSPGAVALTPALFTTTNTFYSPTVSPGAAPLTPALFATTNTFYSPTVSPGAVNLAPALYSHTATFYSPLVANVTPTSSNLINVIEPPARQALRGPVRGIWRA